MWPVALALLAGSAAQIGTSIYQNRRNRADTQFNNEWINYLNNQQIELANSAHQREVADLQAAGLNPILSAGGSGSPVPQLKLPNAPHSDYSGVSNAFGSLTKGLAPVISGELQANVDLAKADASSAQSYADVSKELAQQEVVQAEATADLAKSQASASHYTGLSNQVEEAARLEALTGAMPEHMYRVIQTNDGWTTYNNLVSQYRREIESGNYKASVGRAIFGDVRDAVSTVGDALNGVSSAKSLKTPKPVSKVEQTTFRRDKKGRIIQQMRNRYDVER